MAVRADEVVPAGAGRRETRTAFSWPGLAAGCLAPLTIGRGAYLVPT